MVWIDTIVQGKLVNQSRKDSKYGAIDLIYFQWCCIGIGGFIPPLVGLALFYGAGTETRYYEYTLASLNGIVVLLIAMSIKPESFHNRQAARLSKESMIGLSLL
jgi:hypothetical protein